MDPEGLMTRRRFRWSAPLPEDRVTRYIRRRAFWAFAEAGMNAGWLRGASRISWHRYVEETTDGGNSIRLDGLCLWSARLGLYMIRMHRQDRGMGETLIHELSHAVLAEVETDRAVEHSPVFDALFGEVRRHYVDREDGPTF